MHRCINKIFQLLLIFFPICLFASNANQRKNKDFVADSILNKIFDYSSFYSNVVTEYNADLYIKGLLKVNKRNHLIKYVPSMFILDKKRKEYIIESFNELHFTAPNIYDRKLKALSGTFKKNSGQITDMMNFFNLNVYSSSLMSDKLLSPLNKESSIYYTYMIDSTFFDFGHMNYKIKITSRFRNTQLVDGFVIVSDKTWIVRELYIKGEYDFIDFDVDVKMGKQGEMEELLPLHFDMNLDFKFLGNNLSMACAAVLKYRDIKINNHIVDRKRDNKNKYDLTSSYKLSCDTSHLQINKEVFNKFRLIPLTKNDSLLYTNYDLYKQNNGIDFAKRKKNVDLWGQIGDMLINSYNLNIYGIGSVRCSPLINPVMFSYSHSNGVSYKQRFKYNRFFVGDKLLRVVPQIGFNFTRKELYANMDVNYVYNPEKIGSFNFQVGNGNRIYSSVVLDKLKELPDSTFNFDNVDLDYFRDFRIDLSHSIEPFNGFTISSGFVLHWRYLVNNSKVILNKPLSNEEWAKVRGIKSQYNTFAPRITLRWTPEMYYYMNGKRKMNIGSKMPTFIVDYERGIKGVLGSNGSHERWEFEIQQKLLFNGIRSLGYRVSGGLFTKQDNVYFVDFASFKRNNLPEGWNDDIGGTFQLLDGRWYNSSRRYIRANFTYESPYIILKALNRITSKIQHERVYFGILDMPHLTPYMELGYGIGTHIFDVGAFVSSINGKYDTVGFKFTFELFNN